MILFVGEVRGLGVEGKNGFWSNFLVIEEVCGCFLDRGLSVFSFF